MSRILLCAAVVLLVLPAAAADLADLAWLEGEWQGFSEMGERSNVNHKRFAFEMGGRYLVERTVAMFPPDEPSVDYETHQSAIWYYAIGDELRMKGFYVEGFVQSGAVTVGEDGAVTIESVAVEGGPPGMRTRFVYRLQDDGLLAGTFEIDWSGEGYQPASRYLFKRIR